MVGDHYQDKWRPIFPSYPVFPAPTTTPLKKEISEQEFEQLKKEVADMKELLKRAKAYDEKNNEPNCEIEDKMEFLRQVAKLVGVDLDDVLKKP